MHLSLFTLLSPFLLLLAVQEDAKSTEDSLASSFSPVAAFGMGFPNGISFVLCFTGMPFVLWIILLSESQ